MPRRFLDKAGDHGHLAGRLQQLLDLRRSRAQGQVGHHVADEVAGQRQFGKHDQVGLLPGGRSRFARGAASDCVQIAQHRRDLRQRHAEHGRRPLAAEGSNASGFRRTSRSIFALPGGFRRHCTP